MFKKLCGKKGLFVNIEYVENSEVTGRLWNYKGKWFYTFNTLASGVRFQLQVRSSMYDLY